ncbi:hypothetical protein GKC30_02265 [Pseudodesulfovibrio sp. F-1]|uniref:Uncharacterized protein n=1 Tax=Pseudodesulfovibrio alkaliphilus TaxID=2661613 RepID=A0A7K1KK51_9BACT|nr:hypothetical protein [Pseudodesulfovibrio alkaliphilus]MUM76454.1 hypothetical protein [Pseudodesulfovibrio alkaliphilus]
MGDRTRTSAPGHEIAVGVLIPHGWDDNFSVTSVSLACEGEREIVIGNLESHPGLLVLLRRRVRLTGTVARDGEGETMTVEGYKPVADSDANGPETRGTTNGKIL